MYGRNSLLVTLNDARRVIAAAEARAEEMNQPMNIAVADGGGNLVAHVRMDGAAIGCIDISINKAFTSRCFRPRHERPRRALSVRGTVLRDSCVEQRAGDDLRRRYSTSAGWRGGRSDRSQWRLR